MSTIPLVPFIVAPEHEYLMLPERTDAQWVDELREIARFHGVPEDVIARFITQPCVSTGDATDPVMGCL